jgi:transglutaminase-like putative cysteine protease
VIQSAQVTPSINSLAQQILRDVGDDRVDQAKEIFNFVANYLEYSIDGAYEYPITTLLEREGQCSEYATLLTSLYLASGFETYYVITKLETLDYFQMYHVWVALYLPEYPNLHPGQSIITSKLGEGWVGLDATDNRVKFGELDSSDDLHSNIISIVEPITAVTIYDLKAAWEVQSSTEGSSVHLDVFLKTWEANTENNDTINLTFELIENDVITDTASYELGEYDETTLSVDLSYTRRLWRGEGIQYITISVR